jgi:Putative prokaryotic signal transducing protein
METTTLQTFDNYFSANIILTRLQNEGIVCYLKDEYTSTLNPFFGNVIGGIKLAVDDRQVEKATVLLKQFHDEFMKAAVCHDCGLNEIILESAPTPLNFITKLFTWMFTNYPIAAESIYKCQSCGYESKTLPENVSELN